MVIQQTLLPQLEGKYLFPKPANLLPGSDLFRIINPLAILGNQ